MIITSNTNIDQLAERMGDCATRDEAEAMLNLLCEAGYEGMDTSDIPESDWDRALTAAVCGIDQEAPYSQAQELEKKMSAVEVIEAIKAAAPDIDTRGILAVLEDGAALAALGVTDSDQDAVEDAYASLRMTQN